MAAGDGVAPHPGCGRPSEAPDGAGAEHVRLRDPPDGHRPLRARLPGRRPQLHAGFRGAIGVVAAVVLLGPHRPVQWPLAAQPWMVEGRLQVRRHAVDEVAVGALMCVHAETRSVSVPPIIGHCKCNDRETKGSKKSRELHARTCLDGPERRFVEPLEQRLHPPVPPELLAWAEPLRLVIRRRGRAGKKKRDEQESHEMGSSGGRRRRRHQWGVLLSGLY